MSCFSIFQSLDDKQPIKVQIDIRNIEQILFNYAKLKKIVLKQLGYLGSNKNNIQLSFIGIYSELPNLKTPIFTDQNLKVLLKQALLNKTQIKILFTPLKQLKKRGSKKRPQQVAVQFDSDGSVQSFNQDKFANILPSGGRYIDEKTVRCQFCKKNSKDKDSVRKLGPLYGPFGKNWYVHLICAIWCSRIYISEHNNDLLTGVQQQIQQKGKDICKVCRKTGAALICHSKIKCTYSCHYECGVQDGCDFNWQQYQFLCKKCKLDPKRRRALKWLSKQTMVQQQTNEQFEDKADISNYQVAMELQ